MTTNGSKRPTVVKDTEDIVDRVRRRADTRESRDTRKPIELNPQGAVMSVIGQVLQQDAVKIALGSFLEGRSLEGEWGLVITGATLVPK